MTPVAEVREATPALDTIFLSSTGVDYTTKCEMSEKEFYSVLKAIEAKPFSQEKMETARLSTREKCLSNEQVRGIAKLFNFEEQTLVYET